ncbi:cobalamin biosynthesis protein CobY [Croceicoccus estronivorus]|nr:cobalamin biosynthesis protein CobY [Croceicoccus estronivorus]
MPAALILAGSREGAPDPVAVSEGVAHKALVEVEGVPLLARVHAALSAAGVQRIAVVADAPAVVALAQIIGAEIIEPGRGPSASVARGFARLSAPMLVTTADHALLQPDWVRQFVGDSPPDADVAVLLARRDAVEQAVPDTHRTWLRFADGQWSGCNLFLLATPRAEAAIATWREVEANRKRPWRIAARLGPRVLWDYLRGRLTLSEAVAGLGERIGVRAAVVAAADGLAAVDVDKVADLELVREVAAGR